MSVMSWNASHLCRLTQRLTFMSKRPGPLPILKLLLLRNRMHTMLGVILKRTPRGPASSADEILAPVMDLAAVRLTMPSVTRRGL